MTWARTSAETMESPPWVIRKGWFLSGIVYRLFNTNRLVAICPSAETAMAFAERGIA